MISQRVGELQIALYKKTGRVWYRAGAHIETAGGAGLECWIFRVPIRLMRLDGDLDVYADELIGEFADAQPA